MTASNSPVTWSMAIDLDGDGVFETDIAAYAVEFNTTRGRHNFINANADGFERIPVGVATLILDNHDGRFDAWNADGPYYPNFEPGKLIKITATQDGTTWPVFAGPIDDIQLNNGYLDSMATMVIHDGMEFLNKTPSSNQIELSKQISAAVTDILDDIGYSSDLATDIRKSSDYINHYWSRADLTAAEVVHELAELELGQYFAAADGKFTFHGRHTNKTSAKTLAQADLLKDIARPRPWEVNKDLVRVMINQVTIVANAAIFDLGVRLYVDGGDTDLEMWADYSYSGSEAFAEDIAVTMTANSNSDGSGTDLTTDFDVTETEFSNVAKLQISNNGATGGYISISITGTAYVQANPFYVESGTGKRLFTLNSDFVQDKLKADDYSNFLLEKLNTQTTIPIIRIDAYPSLQFDFELQDVITVNIPLFDINSVKYRVGAIDHEWLAQGGQATRTTVYCEPFLDPGDADVFDLTFPVELSL